MKAAKTLLASALALGVTPLALAEQAIEEVEVLGISSAQQFSVNAAASATADSGDLLKKIPGANANNNGPLSTIAQFRGMYGDRINVSIDGMASHGGCPNSMDSPLSYAPAAMLESLSVYRGIAPVSAAQQSIGGAFEATSKQGSFTSGETFEAHGEIEASAASAASANALFATVTASNNQHKIRIAALDESGDDYEYPDGEVTPTAYDRQRYELGYAFKQGVHTTAVEVIRNETGETGTPALPMDIEYVDTNIAKLGYTMQLDDSKVDFKLQNTDVEHVMTNYHMRENTDTTKYRRALVEDQGQEAKLVFEAQGAGIWRYGMDVHHSTHDVSLTNPNNAMFSLVNFNDTDNRINGVFVETEQKLSDSRGFDFGMRVNRVHMSTDEVSFSGMMGMMATHAATLRDAFNDSDRDQAEHNLDLVAKLHQRFGQHWKLSTELSQKTRSPSYQERYLWLPMESTGGLADGYNYMGDPDLDPETAQEINLGLEWQNGPHRVAPRLFYREVKDYIQGTTITPDAGDPVVTAAIALSTMMNGMAPLQFSNVDATLYGMDVEWMSQINQSLALRGTLSMVRGERDDINDNLYRISPDNLLVAADYQWRQLLSTIEVAGYNKQTRVSETNNEQETAGYTLVNLHFSYQAPYNLQLGFGVENLFDHEYHDHLGGYNRVSNSDVAVGDRLPGVGRNAYAKLKWTF